MITLEVISSPDPNVINTYEFLQNQLYIGRESGNLRIEDSSLRATHVMIEVVGKDLIIHPQKEVEHYLINGKRATEIRKLKLSDTFSIGATTIKIMGFEETQHPSRKQILNDKMKDLLQENSPRLAVIEKLISLSK